MPFKKKYEYDDELKQKIRQEYLNGELTRTLSIKYKISVYTMHKIILRGLKKHFKQNPLIKVNIIRDRDYYEMLGLIMGDGWITKYTVGFTSKDEDLAMFVHLIFKKYNNKSRITKKTKDSIFGKKLKKNSICFDLRINSLNFCNEIKKDVSEIEKLTGDNLYALIDGLMSAEGSVGRTVTFAQTEPNFSRFMPLMRIVLGQENNVSQNQNGCKQAHWSPFTIKEKVIFSHCERKLLKLRNHKAKFNRKSGGELVTGYNMNKHRKRYTWAIKGLGGKRIYTICDDETGITRLGDSL